MPIVTVALKAKGGRPVPNPSGGPPIPSDRFVELEPTATLMKWVRQGVLERQERQEIIVVPTREQASAPAVEPQIAAEPAATPVVASESAPTEAESRRNRRLRQRSED